MAQVGKLREAVQHAGRLGLPLNRHISLHLGCLGIDQIDAVAAIGHFLKLAREWIRSRGGDTAAVWVREDGIGKGNHAHILLHVPAGLTLGRNKKWARKIGGGTYRVGAIETTRVGGRAQCSEDGSDHFFINLANVTRYILKGADPEAAKAFGLKRHGEGGEIIGKRCGTTENIGPTARSRDRLRDAAIA